MKLIITLQKEVTDEAEAETLVTIVKGQLEPYPNIEINANVIQEITPTPP